MGINDDASSAAHSADRGHARRILVVDDNEDSATMLAALLQFDGHEVFTSTSGAEALLIVPSKSPDVVLLDIGLPDMSGYEVASRMKATFGEKSPRLVAITGYGRDEDLERTRASGFTAHLVKPVSFEALRRILADLT